jgi:hypothetical protein
MTQAKRVPLPEVNLDGGRLSLFHEAMMRQAQDEPTIQELWREQDKRYQRKHQQTLREQWAEYHGQMHLVHQGLANQHADKRSRLLLELEEGVA